MQDVPITSLHKHCSCQLYHWTNFCYYHTYLFHYPQKSNMFLKFNRNLHQQTHHFHWQLLFRQLHCPHHVQFWCHRHFLLHCHTSYQCFPWHEFFLAFLMKSKDLRKEQVVTMPLLVNQSKDNNAILHINSSRHILYVRIVTIQNDKQISNYPLLSLKSPSKNHTATFSIIHYFGHEMSFSKPKRMMLSSIVW